MRKYHRDYKARKWAENPEAHKAALRARYAANPEKYKAQAKRGREKNIEKARETARAYYKRNSHKWLSHARLKQYGLSHLALDAMLIAQSYACKICDVEFEHGAGNSSPRQMHVDHCHSTGAVRGLLCRDCNLGLGRFKDSPRSLARAIRYLASESERAALVRNDELFNPEPFTFIA